MCMDDLCNCNTMLIYAELNDSRGLWWPTKLNSIILPFTDSSCSRLCACTFARSEFLLTLCTPAIYIALVHVATC